MGAENNNPKEDTLPAIERSERVIQGIEDHSKDKAGDLGAKKEAAEKLIEEKKAAYEKAKQAGTAKGDREASRLDAELIRLNTAVESINQRLEVIKREAGEDKVDEAQRLEDKADRAHNRAGMIESRDDLADKRDAEVATLKAKDRELTTIIDDPASPKEKSAAALAERAEVRGKIERLEAHKDRADEQLKREALLRAEAEQIRADLTQSERALASLNEGDAKARVPGEKPKSSPGLTERMTSSSQTIALQIADNPPKKGDFASNMKLNLKLVWLTISMAMSPKPLAWDPKAFDEGRRAVLEKVAGMKLTDTTDGKIQVESCPRDEEYQAPLGGTQRVFKEYFGSKWWTALNGVTGPVGDKPGTTLAEFKGGIPTPPSTEGDKAKKLFVDDLAKAGMKDDEQLLPWLEKNSSKVNKAPVNQPANPGAGDAPAQQNEGDPELTELDMYQGVDKIIQEKNFKSQTSMREFFSGMIITDQKIPSEVLTQLLSPTMDPIKMAETLLTPQAGSEGVSSDLIKPILYMAKGFDPNYVIEQTTLDLLAKPLLSPSDCSSLKDVLIASLNIHKKTFDKPAIEVFQKDLAEAKTPDAKASIQRAIDALKANDPKTAEEPVEATKDSSSAVQ